MLLRHHAIVSAGAVPSPHMSGTDQQWDMIGRSSCEKGGVRVGWVGADPEVTEEGMKDPKGGQKRSSCFLPYSDASTALAKGL